MSDPDLLSVIIPTFNSARYLPAALESVAAQDYRPLEVIIIDDGSTDETASVVTDFFRRTELPGYYRYQPNQGPAAARNHGIGLAQGDWIAFLDADDIWTPEKSRCQMQILNEHPQAGVEWGCAITFAGDVSPTESPESIIPPPLSPRYMLQSMLFRRSALEQVGNLDPKLRRGEDVDWLLRAMEQSVLMVIHRDLVVYYRRHANNLTSDESQISPGLSRLLKKSLERRRDLGRLAENRPSSILLLPGVQGIRYSQLPEKP